MAILQDNPDELLPIVDIEGNTIGVASRKKCHSGEKLLHPVVHLHIFNDNGDLYLQQRPGWKKIQPGKWDTAVGGHIGYGENINDALVRETFEELGISNFKPEFVFSYIFESSVDKEFVYSYMTVYNGVIKPSEETDGGRFWSINEIENNLYKNIFTPNFEDEFIKLKQIIEGR